MYRQGLRTSTGPTDLAVGAVADGEVLKRVGSTIVGAAASTGDVVGPASATDNAAVRFDGTTGKLVQNSAVTIADTSGNITCGTVNGVTMSTVVVGPASATDNAIVRFDGTTGKLVQNSAATVADTSGNVTAGTYNGVTVEGHQARHAPGGADDLFAGVADNESMYRSGSAVEGRDERFVRKTSAQTNSTGSTAAVTDLVFTGLKANTVYTYRWVLNYQSDATTTGMVLLVDFTGTVTSTFYGCHGGTGFQAYVNNTVTSDNGSTGSTTFGPGTTNRLVMVEGIIETSSTGDLQLRFVRGSAAGTVTIQLNSYGHLMEAAP